MTRVRPCFPALLRRLGRDTSGVALLEFAFALPIVLTMSLGGAELTNYIITRMRISQIALHLADNAARIGSGSQLQAKTITEADINDLLTGADMQSGELKLLTNGRVIISSIEPDPNNAGKSMIRWERCAGAKSAWTSSIDDNGTTNKDGFGPTGRQVGASTDGVVMFAEVQYQYTPLVRTSLSPETKLTEIASMMVRDRRDTSDDSKNADGSTNPNPQHPLGVYKVNGVTPAASNC